MSLLNDSTFSGNSAYNGGGGIANFGTVTINNSTFSGNSASIGGGALSNSGTATINNSTLSGNSAFSGGGISNFGTLLINHSTLSSNLADNWGGALSNLTTSGNCDAPPRTIIRNSTLSGNSASFYGGGIRNQSGVIEISNSTITANTANIGGGVWSLNDGATCTRVGGTIIAGNSSNDVAADNTTQRFFSLGHNLIGTHGGNIDFGQEFNQASDQVNIVAPLLGALADNGGPTRTHMPRLDSPAVNGGNCASGPTTDQRGEARPQDTTCDIGAVEVQSGEENKQICDLVAGQTYLFGASGVQLTIDTVGTLSCINVAFVNGEHSNATDNIAAPYVTISPLPVEATDFEVSMTLLHPNYANPQICQYPGNMGGYGWYCTRLGFDDHTVWRGGITSFSDWAVGDNVGPTAVTLNALLTTSGGAALPWLALTLLLISLTVTAVWRGRQPT